MKKKSLSAKKIKPNSFNFKKILKDKKIFEIYKDFVQNFKKLNYSNKIAISKKEKNFHKKLTKLQDFVEKNCEYVGEKFAQEARNIHYDKKKSKGIYGRATPEQTTELIEEGIDVATIPWPKKNN